VESSGLTAIPQNQQWCHGRHSGFEDNHDQEQVSVFKLWMVDRHKLPLPGFSGLGFRGLFRDAIASHSPEQIMPTACAASRCIVAGFVNLPELSE
jgi:hypothetical protein